MISYYRDKVYLPADNAKISNAYSYIDEKEWKKLRKKDPTAVNPKPEKN